MTNQIREIVTRAIISKGKKRTRNNYQYEIESITKILGCWICNHHYEAKFQDGKPMVEGQYDLHVWYSQDQQSELFKTTIHYSDLMNVISKDDRPYTSQDVIEPSCTMQPKCVDANLYDGVITIEIEKELVIKVVGETYLKVEIKQEEETWESFDIDEINENFMQ